MQDRHNGGKRRRHRPLREEPNQLKQSENGVGARGFSPLRRKLPVRSNKHAVSQPSRRGEVGSINQVTAISGPPLPVVLRAITPLSVSRGVPLSRGSGRGFRSGAAIEFADLLVAEVRQTAESFNPAFNVRPFVATDYPAQVFEVSHQTLRTFADAGPVHRSFGGPYRGHPLQARHCQRPLLLPLASCP